MTEFIELAKAVGPYWAIVAGVVGGVGYLLYRGIRWMGERCVDVGHWVAPRVDNVINKHIGAIDTLTANIDAHTVALNNISLVVTANSEKIDTVGNDVKTVIAIVKPKGTV